MKKYKLIKADIQFKVNNEMVKFSVYTNMPEKFGLSLSDAVENWLHRTDNYSSNSLCEYIESKQTGYKCITETQFKNLNNEKI